MSGDLGWAADPPPPPARTGGARAAWLASLPVRAVVALVVAAVFAVASVIGWFAALGGTAMDLAIRRIGPREAGHRLFVQWPTAFARHLRDYTARCLGLVTAPRS